ncbi:MAG: DUF535 family protein [Bradyrhizobium sp.]|nr:DUF535 family protein [Bradyrhizobium sp.]
MAKLFSASARFLSFSGTVNRKSGGHFSLVAYALSRLGRVPAYKAFLCAILFIRHQRALATLLQSKRGSKLQKFIEARPEVREMVLTPYLAANWNVPDRLARIVDHCETVETIGGIVDFPPDQTIDVLRLNAIDPRYRITLCQARWLLPDGQLILSLWDDIHRIFHIAFCLSSREGKLVAYVGGIQGRTDSYSRSENDGLEFDLLERYRHFTKAASGLRPRDFLVETFKVFCQALGVAEIRAVSDSNRRPAIAEIKLSYDEIWRERGGSYAGHGFFILPTTASRRADEDIPAKKKAMYRKRYAMMSIVEAELVQELRMPARHIRDQVGMNELQPRLQIEQLSGTTKSPG